MFLIVTLEKTMILMKSMIVTVRKNAAAELSLSFFKTALLFFFLAVAIAVLIFNLKNGL